MEVIWRGSKELQDQLLRAIANNCECQYDDALLSRQCASHHMLIEQRVLDGLLFGRAVRHRLKAEEWSYLRYAL